MIKQFNTENQKGVLFANENEEIVELLNITLNDNRQLPPIGNANINKKHNDAIEFVRNEDIETNKLKRLFIEPEYLEFLGFTKAMDGCYTWEYLRIYDNPISNRVVIISDTRNANVYPCFTMEGVHYLMHFP
jgi:hypothetical protein